MTLRLPELTRIAEAVAREEDRTLKVVSVASSDGDSERVELLVTVAGCHGEPCTFLMNLSRAGQMQFEEELKSELRAVLRRHLTPDAS